MISNITLHLKWLMDKIPQFFQFDKEELYFFDMRSKKVCSVNPPGKLLQSLTIKSLYHPLLYQGCPYVIINQDLICHPHLVALKKVQNRVFGMDLNRIVEIDGGTTTILFQTTETILDFLMDSRCEGLLVHTTRKGVSSYQASDLWYIKKTGLPLSLNSTNSNVTHFAFDTNCNPFFLTDTNSQFESHNLDPYKKRFIGCSNILMFHDHYFLVATREGVDVLIECQNTSWIEHPLPFTSIQELFTDGYHLYVAGFGQTGPLSVVKSQSRINNQLIFSCFYQNAHPLTESIQNDLSFSHQLQPLDQKMGKGWIVGKLDLDKPVIIRIHGGPISHVEKRVTEEVLFFHSKGYNLIYPNYRGSTGYKRAHRVALIHQYSIADVKDISNLVDSLLKKGIDPKKIILKGKSSAGLTAILSSLKVQVGALLIYCPLTTNIPSDGELKFLFPPKYDPFKRAIKVKTPMVLFQGDQDTIIEKKWTDRFVQEVIKTNCSVQYHVLSGVGHSIRDETENQCLRMEDDFLTSYFKS